MNRIILIGNGFDLAHGLKTKYEHFIDAYWEEECEFLSGYPKHFYSGSGKHDNIYIKDMVRRSLELEIKAGNAFIELLTGRIVLKDHKSDQFSITNKFLKIITEKHPEKWVDIEYEYFLCLKKALKGEYLDGNKDVCANIKTLNDDFERIDKCLINYLNNKKGEAKDCKGIKENIFSTIDIRDLSLSHKNAYIESVMNDVVLTLFEAEAYELKLLLENYGRVYGCIYSSVSDMDLLREELKKKDDVKKYLKNLFLKNTKYNKEKPLPKDYELFLVPKKTMFLNFNYTDTPEKYIPEGDDVSDIIKTISIHGQLNNKGNPTIFGYGDEMGDDYKEFENSAENMFLKNAKSIRYNETDNYRKLMEFAESDYFQVFIMGHSCGLSDRTLLNTLFEHRNCVSIKPFYYIRENGTDDYSDIVQNISRNFSDKVKMRDRVVNKTYCTAMTNTTK